MTAMHNVDLSVAHLPVTAHDALNINDIHDTLAPYSLARVVSAARMCRRLAALRAMHYEHMTGTLGLHPVSRQAKAVATHMHVA